MSLLSAPKPVVVNKPKPMPPAPKPVLPKPELVVELPKPEPTPAKAQVDVVVPSMPRHFDIDLPPRRTRIECLKSATRYASEDDVKDFASNIPRIKGRQRVMLEAVMEHGLEEGARKLGVVVSSVVGYLSTASTVLGIPRTNRFHPYDRMDAMLRAWAYYKANPEIEGPAKANLRKGEWRLLELFRDLRPEDKAQMIEIMKIFASKSK